MIGSNVAIITAYGNQLVCRGKIIDKVNNIILVHMFTSIQYLEQDVIILEYSYSKETFIYSGHITALHEHAMTISNIKIISKSERRHNPRININDKALLVSYLLEKDYIISLGNISTSGLLFTSGTEFSTNDRLSVQMPLETKEKQFIITGQAEIVRQYKNENLNTYGCKFKNMSDDNRQSLYDFIKLKKPQFFQKNVS